MGELVLFLALLRGLQTQASDALADDIRDHRTSIVVDVSEAYGTPGQDLFAFGDSQTEGGRHVGIGVDPVWLERLNSARPENRLQMESEIRRFAVMYYGWRVGIQE